MSIATDTQALPLSGVRVIELAQFLSGPLCGMLLGDWGAEVVKVEQPGSGDETRRQGPPFLCGVGAYFLSCNRNKKSVTLDLKKPKGKQLFLELIRQSDILIENLRPGAMEKLGLSYEDTRDVNPSIIYCSISGFGHSGPYMKKGGYDQVIQGMSGIMSITGEKDGPPVKVGAAISDIAAAMYAFASILMCLYERQVSPDWRGRHLDIAMLDCAISWLTFQAQRYFLSGEIPERMGTQHPLVSPYECYRTKDGFVNISAGNDRLFADLCEVLGLSRLPQDQRFKSNPDRVVNRRELNAILEPEIEKLSTSEIVEKLNEKGVPAGPVFDISQVFADEHVISRGMKAEVWHPVMGNIPQIGSAIKLSGFEWYPRTPPPLLGEHTDEVLTWLGKSDAEIANLRREGIV